MAKELNSEIKNPTESDFPAYDAAQIEKKWQDIWEKTQLYKTDEDVDKPKKYVLEMFPYPSGDLHMGHARNYTIGDAMARHARMCGFDVLHPIGFDAFGLPAENAAIKHKTQAKKWTYENMDRAVHTMHRMGLSYDFDRLVKTCDPNYYKWGQWIFLKMWERGLVYRATSPVNWCPSCDTVLANEQVVDGRCWRCGSVPEKRELSQWYLRITAYAQELLDDLDKLSGWPDRVLQMQKNWIGRSEGAEIDFALADKTTNEASDTKITVFTTRADTLFGCSFMLLPPESPLAAELVKGSAYEEAFKELKRSVEQISGVDRQGSAREKHGVFTGRYVINPITGQLIPVWVADYVLLDYGTGAVMGVPSGDQRDFDFARKYGLDIPPIICQQDDPLYEQLKDEKNLIVKDVSWDHAMEAEGYLIQSGEFTGLRGGKGSPAEKAIVEYLSEHNCGSRSVQFRLRDWLISRQRFWGNPIPMIHCDECGDVPVPEEDLPVLLPENLDLSAGQTLAEYAPFYETRCPRCGKAAKRITDTMDTFTCSSWYYLRYCDPHNTQAPFSKEAAKRWMPVDNYIGGIEHAILHLLYSRFWTKVLRDLGLLDIDEPFSNLLCQGMVKDEHGEVMSKSKGNVVPPASVIEPYGADTMRLTILFIAPAEKDCDWDPHAVEGANRFLRRAWRIVWLLAKQAQNAQDVDSLKKPFDPSILRGAAAKLHHELHKLGIKCSEDFERAQYNTAISSVMELVNAASRYLNDAAVPDQSPQLAFRVAHDIVAMLAPIVPHWAEELFSAALGYTHSVYNEPWPTFDKAQVISDTIELAVQLKGKVKAHIEVDATAAQDEIEQLACKAVADQLEGKEVKKVIIVPGRLVNIVAV